MKPRTYTVEELGYNRETMFPNWANDLEMGRPLIARAYLIEAAQDRIAMRRYIRHRFPGLPVSGMSGEDLSQLVDNIRMLEQGNK